MALTKYIHNLPHFFVTLTAIVESGGKYDVLFAENEIDTLLICCVPLLDFVLVFAL